MSLRFALVVSCVAVVACGVVRGEPDPPITNEIIPVTVDNFVRAETDLYFGNIIKERALGDFHHNRELVPIDRQIVVRSNRDTLYSNAVFDLNAGVVTITLPNPGARFMSMAMINQDHYCYDVVYQPGTYSFSRAKYVTRYLMMGVRILVDPNNLADFEQVHKLQNSILIVQHGEGPGKFEVPRWEPESQKKVRDALSVLGSMLPEYNKAFGRPDDVEPVRHLIGTATAWGGNPDKDVTYLNVAPKQNDGKTAYRLTVKDVPVDGFWSISVYNTRGFFEPNPQNAYTLNNLTAKKDADGSVTLQFGGDPGKAPNWLPITPGWNYMVRLYRPRPEIIDGTWKFPEAKPAQ